MALHAAAMMAFFVDQAQQAQCAIKCMPSVPEPKWKWWFGALAPWVGPLLSCVVSIFVAWRVFSWQGSKDRKQWVRDQKREEWKELLKAIAEFGNAVPVVTAGYANYEEIARRSVIAIQKLEETYANSPFLFEFASSKANNDKISEFQEQAEKVADHILSQGRKIKVWSNDIKKKLDVANERSKLCMTFRGQYVEFVHWLQAEARKDLGFGEIKPSEPPSP